MKAKTILLPITLATMAMPSDAATLLGVTAGANFWQSEATVQAGEVADAQFTLNQDKESNNELFLSLEHGLPIIPNFKYVTSDLSVQGRQQLTQTYILSGQTYRVASTLSANYQYDYSDYTLYYELFDNQAIEFDIGITLKDIDAEFAVANVNDASEASSRVASGIEPYLYSSAKLSLPLLNLGFSTVVNVQDGSNYDFELALQYQLATMTYVQLGWKKQEVDFDDFDSLYFQHSWDAAFAGIVFSF